MRAPRGTTGVRRGGGGSRSEDSAKPAPPLPLFMAGPTGSRRTQVGSGVTIAPPTRPRPHALGLSAIWPLLAPRPRLRNKR